MCRGRRQQQGRRPSVDIYDHSTCCDAAPPPLSDPEARVAPLWPPHLPVLQPNAHGVWAVAHGHRGGRRVMEDRHRIVYGQGCRAFVAVYDGHGGQEAADFAANHLHQYMRFGGATPPFATHDAQVAALLSSDSPDGKDGGGSTVVSRVEQVAAAAAAATRPQLRDADAFRREIEYAFGRAEADILTLSRRLGTRDGTTAACVWIHEGTLYAANVGDSRVVLCRGGAAVPVTRDHKPHDATEKKRILAAGGEVRPVFREKPGYCCFQPKWMPQGADRLWPGGFSVSRALGDIDYKEPHRGKVSAVTLLPHPEVSVTRLTKEDSFVVLGTDGLFDVMTSEDVCEYIRKETRKKGCNVERLAERLANRAYQLGSEDNITVLIAFFTSPPPAPPSS